LQENRKSKEQLLVEKAKYKALSKIQGVNPKNGEEEPLISQS
jgi:hypothetical protein